MVIITGPLTVVAEQDNTISIGERKKKNLFFLPHNSVQISLEKLHHFPPFCHLPYTLHASNPHWRLFVLYCILYLFIQSSYMGPWPTEYRTCQNLCNINKAKYLFLSLQKVLHIGGQVIEGLNSRAVRAPLVNCQFWRRLI